MSSVAVARVIHMGGYTQSERLLSIGDFSVGEDTFLLTSFEGTERLSGLFEFRISVLSENLDIRPEAIVGKDTTVRLAFKTQRTFNGYVRSFTVGEIQGDSLREYRIVMVPWLWFLTQTNNHRIFQDLDTKNIVSRVFDSLGFSDYEFRMSNSRKRDYCVQHNESDFHFVSRLLEEDGAIYYFSHESDKHKLIISDTPNAFEELPETNLEYSKGSNPDVQISSWNHIYTFRKGKWSLRDYVFTDPQKDVSASAATTSSFANNARYEHYEYPAAYDSDKIAEFARIRLEAEESARDCVQGTSGCSSFQAGGRFRLAKHITAGERGDYILVEVTHKAHDRSYFSGQGGSSGYSNEFLAVPAEVSLRPKPLHKKPYMRGPQTAVVVGPAGEEIYTDDFGRVKVQFIWDREGQKNENSSCFIRVMQSWAGNQWGASFVPRIGHEVVVDFLDGDPDRPIITGSVYNGWNKPVYESKTQSGIKTRSTKGGGPQNFNELRFDDRKGEEQVFIHAEKDFDIEVENDQSLLVEHDRTKTVGNNESYSITNDRNKKIGGSQTESIAKDKKTDVGGNHTESIGKDQNITIGKNSSLSVSENHSESIGKNVTISVGKDLSETVSGQHSESVSKAYGLSAKTITLQAADQITLKTGSASIVMKKNGDIVISGANLNIKGSGNVIVKGSKITSN